MPFGNTHARTGQSRKYCLSQNRLTEGVTHLWSKEKVRSRTNFQVGEAPGGKVSGLALINHSAGAQPFSVGEGCGLAVIKCLRCCTTDQRQEQGFIRRVERNNFVSPMLIKPVTSCAA